MKKTVMILVMALLCILSSCDGGWYAGDIGSNSQVQPQEPEASESTEDVGGSETEDPAVPPDGEEETEQEEGIAGEVDEPAVSIRAPQVTLMGFKRPSGDAVVAMSKPDNATVFYTTDGSDPRESNGYRVNYNRNEYTQHYSLNRIASGVIVNAGCIINAVAYKDGIYSKVVTFEVPTEIMMRNPTIIVKGVTSDGATVVSMHSNDPEAYIYYTTDGSNPSPGNGDVYSYDEYTYIVDGSSIVGGIKVWSGTTVKAMAKNTYNGNESGVSVLTLE
mgnify:FL=1